MQGIRQGKACNEIWVCLQGVGPTSQRAGIIAAVELPVYDGFKKYFIDHNILNDGPPNHIMYESFLEIYPYSYPFVNHHLFLFRSSFLASLAAAIASTPVDVIRVC